MTALPNFTGVWLADRKRSRYRTQVPHKLLLRITHEGTDIRHEILSFDYHGTARRAELRFTIGSKIEIQFAETPTTIEAQWQGEELVIKSRQVGGDAPFVDYWSLSPDGDTMTMAHRDDLLKGQICVLNRAPLEDAKLFD